MISYYSDYAFTKLIFVNSLRINGKWIQSQYLYAIRRDIPDIYTFSKTLSLNIKRPEVKINIQ